MLHCTAIFFPQLNHTDLLPVIYQAGNEKNEKYRGCSNVSASQLTGMKGKLRRGNDVKAWSCIRRQPDVRLSMLQVNKPWNTDPPHQSSHPSSCHTRLQLLITTSHLFHNLPSCSYPNSGMLLFIYSGTVQYCS